MFKFCPHSGHNPLHSGLCNGLIGISSNAHWKAKGLSQEDLAEAMVCIEYTLVEWNVVNEILVEQVFESCKRRIVALLAVAAIF